MKKNIWWFVAGVAFCFGITFFIDLVEPVKKLMKDHPTEVSILLISLICGFVAAETRLGLEGIHNKNQEDEQPLIIDRKYRYLIGVVTSYVAIVTLAYGLKPLNQSVIGIIAALSGNTFLTKQVDGFIGNQKNTNLNEQLNQDIAAVVAEYEKAKGNDANKQPPAQPAPAKTEEAEQPPAQAAKIEKAV